MTAVEHFLWDDVWGVFINGFCVSLVLPAVLAAVGLILVARAGWGMGLPQMFWQEWRDQDGTIRPARGRQFFTGLGVGVLVWQVLLAGYLSEEFASNYVYDHPPFCEVRPPYQDGAGLTDGPGVGDFPGRFRYRPDGVEGIGLYFGSVVVSAVALGVLVTLLILAVRLLNFLAQTAVGRRGAPFRKRWKPYRRPSQRPATVVRRVRRLLKRWAPARRPSLLADPDDVTRPTYSPYLPLGVAAGIGIMFGAAAVGFGDAVRPTLERVGEEMIWAGGYGLQNGRQTSLGAVMDRARAVKKNDPNPPTFPAAERPKTPAGMTPPAGLVPSQPELVDKGYDVMQTWYRPYAPVFGLFLVTFVGVAAVTLFLSQLSRWSGVVDRQLASSAGWVLFYLHLPTSVIVGLSYFLPFGLQAAYLALGVAVAAAGVAYKFRFPGIAPGVAPDVADGPVNLAKRYAEINKNELAAVARSALADAAPRPSIPTGVIPFKAADGPRRPLALVCCSGGGSRAMLWTMKMLTELEGAFGAAAPAVAFPYHVRLLTGASGGFVAASAYAASLDGPGGGAVNRVPWVGKSRPWTADDLVRQVGRDFLTPVVRRLGLWDIPGVALPFRRAHDRGWEIEEAWNAALPGVLDRTFADLWAGELAGWRPSLIASPMMVEDGRQLFITNLRIRGVTRNLCRQLVADPDAPNAHLLSREGVEFFDLFPHARETFRVGTAARMSASFPYVLPAVPLPTNPPRRVVDAGYYDNYGVGIAAGWLGSNLDWVFENASGVVIIQIRDGASRTDRLRTGVSDDAPGAVGRGFHWLTSPPAGLWQTRVATHMFRNDSLLHHLNEGIALRIEKRNREKGDRLPPDYFTVATFELAKGDSVPLSWTLSERERQLVDEGAVEHEPVVRELIKWWHARSPAASPPAAGGHRQTLLPVPSPLEGEGTR